jgi:HSP20 family molecular chaperone IbpA
MHVSNISYNRGLLDLAMPLFMELEKSTNENYEDFFEREDSYNYEVEMAGYDRKDIKINIDSNGDINLQAKRKRRGREVNLDKAYSIPESADPSSLKASLDKGILTLTLGKKEKYKPREIKVN